MPVAEFYGREGTVYASFIHNNQLQSIIVHEEEGREYNTDNFSWTVQTEKHSPRVDHLNGKIYLEDYFSCYYAWYCLGYLLSSNQAAWYFRTESKSDSTIFQVPGLQPVKYENIVVTFTRDASQPLINPDQIELLKKSSTDWYSQVGHQLDNPVWQYDAKKPILSVKSEDNRVFVSVQSENSATTTSFN